MAWRVIGGPHPAPWAGRDATGWVWELTREPDDYAGIIVWVSGTAMAIADRHLPAETALARATEGRSEIDRLLETRDPPRQILMTTTGRSIIEPTVEQFESGWWIELDGEQKTLEAFAQLFAAGDVRVIEIGGRYYLRDPSLDELADDAAVQARGAQLVAELNGAARLQDPMVGRVEYADQRLHG